MHKKNKVLKRSLDWVRRNHRATNLDVPEEFVAEWIFDDDGDEPKPAGFFFSVFAFGYMQYEVLTQAGPSGGPRSVPMLRLVETFELWQMKLALAQIHRRTDIQVDPMPLFGFPEGEEVKYWPRVTAHVNGGSQSSQT